MKIKVIYYIVLFFCIAALAWWAYSLINFCFIEYRQKSTLLEQELNLAEMNLKLMSSNDTILNENYQINGFHFLDKKEILLERIKTNHFNSIMIEKTSLNEYVLKINEETQKDLKAERNRKIFMYVIEAMFFIAAFLWGLIWIYSRLNSIIKLNFQKSNFMMAITHELKTPMASLKLMLQTIQKRKLEPEKLQELIAMGIGDVERLSDLTENILVASQVEGGNYDYNFQKYNLSEFLKQIVEDYNLRHGASYFFEYKIASEINWIFDKMALTLVFNNLLDNSMKYSPKNSVIKIEMEKVFQQINIYVIDEGLGITDEESEQIFEKFYRSGNENTRKTKGTGLGLFIVKKILEDHHTTIQLLRNKQQKGTTFYIQIIDGK